MNKFLLSLLLTLCCATAFAQRYSQYNTGTLYDSFENPAQRAFIPDSSRGVAFNFLIPSFNSYSLLTGNSQSALLQRAFVGNYAVRDSSRLLPTSTKSSHLIANANVYAIMFKVFTSLDGNQEVGFSAQTRAEGRGVYTDQLAMLFSGINVNKFANNTVYNNALNTKLYYQAYHQFSFTYREQVNKQFALGIKLSALLGIAYNKLDINQSALQYSGDSNANIYLGGQLHSSYVPGQFEKHDLLPNFRNPGASISIGTMFRTRDGFILQGNIKDLGFIHWSKNSQVYDFGNFTTLEFNNRRTREDNIFRSLNNVIQKYPASGSFNTPIHGRAEFSAARTFYVAGDNMVKYTPTLIVAKQFYDPGTEAALVNHIQYGNAILTLTGIYNDLRTFSLGTQLMVKSPNVDFYVGSDALKQSITTLGQSHKNEDLINRNASYSAASVYMGFSIKFGNVIEHPMNASRIPMGEKGFFGRLWGRLFKTDR
ncbi:hypothetical protein GCM10027037_13470 [Mucilaginibacter koreensis]